MSQDKKYFYYYLIAILLLAIPAFFINLGLLPYIEDESIRSLVALEMKYSGNYLVPTLNGNFYYSKPPLYNWYLLVIYQLLGEHSAWAGRVGTLLCLTGFIYTIYKVNKAHFKDIKYPIFIALFYLTCGRIIFWDSFLALIDIGFSWVVYGLFISVYYFGKRDKYWAMYMSCYVLGSIAYLLKGLPAFLFIGGTLLAYHWVRKDWKKLWSPAHIVSIIAMLFIVGAYYFYYGEHNESTAVIPGLVDQSTQRTVLRHGVLKMLLHIITYPFENIYHFLPWSVIGVLFLRKDIWQVIKAKEYIHYISVCFLINISVYWVSPAVFPRYILMLIPLIYTVLVYLLSKETESWRLDWLKKGYQLIMLAAPVVIISLIAIEDVRAVEDWAIKIAALLAGGIILGILYFRDIVNRPLQLVMLVLLIRIAFDWFILPSRYQRDNAVYPKERAIAIGQEYKGKDLMLYCTSKLDYTSSFYLARERGEITYRNHYPQEGDRYMIADTSRLLLPRNYEVIDTFRNREDWKLLYILERDETVDFSDTIKVDDILWE